MFSAKSNIQNVKKIKFSQLLTYTIVHTLLWLQKSRENHLFVLIFIYAFFNTLCVQR